MAATGNADIRFTWVDGVEALGGLCDQLHAHEFIALDTEFVRVNTFYPKVGLIQVASADGIALIDPLQIRHWEPFIDRLVDSRHTFVLHSCGEDLGLLRHFLGVLPKRLFDTQRAAAFLGHGYSVSYQALVLSELQVALEKGETRSDWTARPLSERQCHYAALDVACLLPLQLRLQAQLQQQNRLEWFAADCMALLQEADVVDDARLWASHYRNVSGASFLNQRQLLSLQHLTFWREQQARAWDRPRSWVIRDADLVTLASRQPNNLDDLRKGTELSDKLIARHGEALLRCIQASHKFDDIPDPKDFSRPLTPFERRQLQRSQQAVGALAASQHLAPELLARKRLLIKLLENLRRGDPDPWPHEMSGWRRPLLEATLMAILSDRTDEPGALHD